MTSALNLLARPARAITAFFVLLSAIVFVPGGPAADAADEGLSIQKTVDDNTIIPGATSLWTLTIETDPDITLATGITVTDTLPDGLCLAGVGDPDCPGGTAPSPAHTAATENADGTWTVQWDLPDMATSELVTITYSTVARSYYQEAFADATPVLARDSWNNTAHVGGTVDGNPSNDYTAAGQAAGSVTIVKDVASRPDTLVGPGVCGDGSGLTWNPFHADGYRVGDQVCWRLTVDYPAGVMTRNTAITDMLPPGQLYTAADTWAAGSGNTVPVADIDGSAIGTNVSSLAWSVGDAGGYVAKGHKLEIVFSSTIIDPAATTSGQTVPGPATLTHTNSNGSSFNSGDSARVEVVEPELAIVKGVAAVNGSSTGGSNNVDGVRVMAGDVVTYRLTITNTGDLDATNVELWDILPDEYAACSSNVGVISDGGTCLDGANRIEWSGGAAFHVPAGAVVTRTYPITIPGGIAPNERMSNTAGIRTFASITNNGGGLFTYVPAANIDTGLAGQNTTAASDPSDVFTDIPIISNARTTSVDDAGNDPHWQATIGELITYTVSVLVPQGTTVYSAGVVDDLPVNLDLVSASHTYNGSEPLTLTVDDATDTVTVAWPTPYTNAAGSGDDTLVLTIEARVIDIPTNTLGVIVDNSAEFTWFNQDASQRDIHASITTTLVEPSITVDKSSLDSFANDGLVVGGELVDTVLTVTNLNQPNVSTAHDVAVIDTLPEGVTPTIINDGGVWAADVTPGDGVGGTITWILPVVAPGVPATPSYQVATNDPVVVNSVFTNTVSVAATSMAGSPTDERTAGMGYAATDSVTLTSPLAAITKSAIPTSATIGGVVRYSISVTIPPGSIMYDGTVLDILPDDVSFDGIAATSCVMGAGACVPAVDVQHVYHSGQTYSFFLGDIDTSSAQARVLTIAYDTHVDSTVGAGATRTNGASIFGNTTDLLTDNPGFVGGPFHVSTGPAESTIDIVEPNLSIDKDVSGQSGDSDWRRARPGDFLDYTLLVANNGSDLSPAYDITVVDTLPVGVSAPSLLSGGGVWAAGPRTITWTIPGPLNPGTSQALSYRVFVDAGLDWTDENAADGELINTGDITSYYGVAEAERLANGFTYAVYGDTVADAVSVELDLAQIGDYVWFDVDGDGVQDGTEPPLAGVDIAITYHGPDATLGTGDDETFNTVTGADGSYHADHLPGGIYTVVVDHTDLSFGMEPSYNFDSTLDHTWSGSLIENGNEARIDFGYTGTGSIGNAVWFDIDADGVYSGSEYGLEGVAVTITWLGPNGAFGGGDDATYLTATNASGYYLVEDLPSGLYTVAIDPATLPAGMVPTYDANGLGPPAHSSALILGPDEDNLDQDFGYAGTGSIGDLIWFDEDGDASQDLGENGLAGAPIQLTWPGEDGVLGGGDDEPILTTTGASGNYLFEYLPPGEYQIHVLGGLPAAATNTADPDGGGDSTAIVNLGDGVVLDTFDFGYNGTASIGDAVWWDINGDGTVNVGEPGIPNVVITLTYAGLDGTIGNGDDLTFMTTTDANGHYLFTDLPQGNFQVAVTGGIPAGFSPTYDESGPVDETSLISNLSTAELHLTADFAYTGAGSVGDFVWLDLSADGFHDTAEPGIPGVAVYLVWYGGDGSEGNADDITLSTTTDIDGGYMFLNLPVGGYDVIIDPATLPPGVSAIADADGLATVHFSSLALVAGGANLDQDFGYVGGRAIGDTVWFDRDADGTIGVDEYGVGGVAVDVTWGGPDGVIGNADDEAFTRITDIDGNYVVGNLPPGEYHVTLANGTLPSGMAATYDEDHTLDNQTMFALAADTDHLTADFGFAGSGMIGGDVWLDLNGDGSQDAGEPGIRGQDIELTWSGIDAAPGTADDQRFTTMTGAGGSYSFDNLPPGSYDVAVSGPVTGVALNTHDEDGDLDSHTAVSLADGVIYLTADFGYSGTAQIGDFVWLDIDGDGIADGDEPGLSGVEVTISWHGPDGIPGTSDDLDLPVYTTDGGGYFLAGGLPAGSYGVAPTGGIPPGLVNSADEDGDLDGHTGVAGLVAGASHATADFGYTGTGSVGDVVWWDLNGDGSQALDEPGLAEVTVTLAWAGLDGVSATSDDIVLNAATDADGVYLFEHLPPGDYTVAVDETTLPTVMTQSGDPDSTHDGTSAKTLGAAEVDLDHDFGYRGEGSVSGVVWHDFNGDRVPDSAEPGIAGVTLTVTYLGTDGVAGGDDDFVFATVTNATGVHYLPGLPSGFYSVDVDEETLPLGIAVTSDLDGGDPLATSFTLGAAAHKSDIDYSVAGNGSLSGGVWNDIDGDQIADADEAGIPGITVTAMWDGPAGPLTVSAVSDPDGFWSLDGLPRGDYSVALDLATVPEGMMPTTPAEAAVGLPGGANWSMSFGLATVVDVGSRVWIDRDGNGVADPDEAGIPDVLVNLFDQLGALVGIAETDENGSYLIADLLPGTYLVQVDPRTLPGDVLATWDRDGRPDLNTFVDLTLGADVLDADFGFQVGLPLTGLEVGQFALWGIALLLLGAALAAAALLRQEQLAAIAPVAEANRWTPSRPQPAGEPTADHPAHQDR